MTAAANIYHNLSGLESLRFEARKNSADGVDKVARQFESLFVQMMLKSMREATIKGGLFDSSQMDTYQSMFDQQISLDLSRHGGIGLSDTLRRQLDPQVAATHNSAGDQAVNASEDVSRLIDELTRYRLTAVPTMPVAAGSAQPGPITEPANASWQPQSPGEFVSTVWDHARASAQDLGVDPRVLVAQSALETGWGKKVISDTQGRSSYNLFGIKADSRWSGDAVNVSTLEYRDNVARPEMARFRSYDSVAHSFSDYVDFLRSNPRYQGALANTGDSKAFLNALQNAGYATDPAYAEKVLAVLDGLDSHASGR